MSQKIVFYGPSSEVALVSPAEGEFWKVSMRSNEVVREYAPHMFNMHNDPFRKAERTEEDYPFPLVRKQLEKLVLHMKTFESLFSLLNPQYELQLRVEVGVPEANAYSENADAVAYAREILLRVPLPEEYEFHHDVLTTLAEPLRKVLEETEAKWRPKTT